MITTRTLTHIRGGDNEKAIKQLEDMLDMQTIDRVSMDTDFGKYIIGLPKRDVKNEQLLKAQIIDYRISANYKCTTFEPACEVINAYIHNEKQGN